MLSDFEKIAPALMHPLVLVGFVLLLFFGIHQSLIKSGIIPPVTRQVGGRLLRTVLRYGFVIAILMIVLGFALGFFKAFRETDPEAKRVEAVRESIDQLSSLIEGGKLPQPLAEDALRAIKTAVQDLRQHKSEPNVSDALAELDQGNTLGAKAIFLNVLNTKQAEGTQANQEAAEAARNYGALAYLDDTKQALEFYQRAVKLDPDNADGWIQLGNVSYELGNTKDTEYAFRKVIDLGKLHADQSLIADGKSHLSVVYAATSEGLDQAERASREALVINEALGRKLQVADGYASLGFLFYVRRQYDEAENLINKAIGIYNELAKNDDDKANKSGLAHAYTNLGNVYGAHGRLEQAEDAFKKSLDINRDLDRKRDMAADFTNLGLIYQAQNKLPEARTMFCSALETDDKFAHKQGLAADYANLGGVYEHLGNPDYARVLYQKSHDLFTEAGDDQGASVVQQWLDALPIGRAVAKLRDDPCAPA